MALSKHCTVYLSSSTGPTTAQPIVWVWGCGHLFKGQGKTGWVFGKTVWKQSVTLFFLGVTGDTEITHSCLINELSEQSESMQPVQLASLTSWYPIFLAEVKGEVSVKQRRVILVHNVTGCYAPQVTQTPLLRQGKKDSSWETQEQWTKTILAF